MATRWGTENTHELDEEQRRYAQLLADLDVDVVMGSHPHIIQPLQWVQGSSGHRTLVAYSLGNFLSNHATPKPDNALEGMLSCDFVKGDDGIEIQDIVWTPLVNHDDGNRFAIYAAKDYTDELAGQSMAFNGEFWYGEPTPVPPASVISWEAWPRSRCRTGTPRRPTSRNSGTG